MALVRVRRRLDLHRAHVDPLLRTAPDGRRGEDADIAGTQRRAGAGGGGLHGVDWDGDDLPHSRLRVRLHGL